MSDRQQGVMLIEAMIALLIFAMGVLAVIGMQARSIGQTMDARYRVDAAFLANQLLSEIWASRTVANNGMPDTSTTTLYGNPTFYSCNPCTSTNSNPVIQGWVQQIQSTTSQSAYLPGVTDTQNAPVISVSPATPNSQPYTITVTLHWKSPQGGVTHNYTTMAQING
jgi:type IV pilus assembly protein PilV